MSASSQLSYRMEPSVQLLPVTPGMYLGSNACEVVAHEYCNCEWPVSQACGELLTWGA